MADSNFTIEIEADDEASPEIEKLAEAIQSFNRAEGQASDSTDEMAAELDAAEDEVKDLRRQVDRLEDEMDKAEDSAIGMGEIMGGELGSEAIMAMGEAAAEAAMRLGEMTVQTAKNVGSMSRAAEAAGVAEEEYQKLTFAMRKVGGDAQMVKDALGTLSERAVDARMGAQGIKDDFSTLGITVDELQNKQPGELFRLVARRVRSAESDTKALKGAVALLGDEVGNKLVSRIRSGEQGIEALRNQAESANVVLGEQQVAALERADSAIETAQSSWRGLRRQITADVANDAAALADETARIAKNLSEADDSGGFLESLTEMGTGAASQLSGGEPSSLVSGFRESVESVHPVAFLMGETEDALEETGERVEKFKKRVNQAGSDIKSDSGFKGSISSLIEENGRLQESFDRARHVVTEYGADTNIAQGALNDFKEKLREVTNAQKEANEGASELQKTLSGVPTGGDKPFDAPTRDRLNSVDLERIEAQKQQKQIRQTTQAIRQKSSQLLDAESEQKRTQLKRERANLKARRARLKVQKQGLKGIKKQNRLLAIQNRRKRKIKQLDEQAAKAQARQGGGSAASGIVSQAKSAAKSADQGTSAPSVDSILGGDEVRQQAQVASQMDTDVGGAEALRTAKRQEKQSKSSLKSQRQLAGGLKGFSQQTQGIGRAANEASRLASAMESVGSSTQNAVQGLSAMSGPLSEATAGMAKVAAKSAKGKDAFEAQAQAISGVVGSVGNFAAAQVKSEKKKAKIKAATEAAASVANFAAYAASAFTAQNLLAASVQHGAAAAMFGGIAGSAGGGGGSGGGAGGGGGGGGGGGSQAATPDQDFNLEKERQKTMEGFAKAVKQEQNTRPVTINVDASGAALPSEQPRFIEDVKEGLERTAGQSIGGSR